jgi:hypothetical protein
MKDTAKENNGDRENRDIANDDLANPDSGHSTDSPNPPRTTKGKWTAPKFGSAGSGGAELEPGPEED